MVGHKQTQQMVVNRLKTTLLTQRVIAQRSPRGFLAGNVFGLDGENFRSSGSHFWWFFDGLVNQCLDMRDVRLRCVVEDPFQP